MISPPVGLLLDQRLSRMWIARWNTPHRLFFIAIRNNVSPRAKDMPPTEAFEKGPNAGEFGFFRRRGGGSGSGGAVQLSNVLVTTGPPDWTGKHPPQDLASLISSGDIDRRQDDEEADQQVESSRPPDGPLERVGSGGGSADLDRSRAEDDVMKEGQRDHQCDQSQLHPEPAFHP